MHAMMGVTKVKGDNHHSQLSVMRRTAMIHQAQDFHPCIIFSVNLRGAWRKGRRQDERVGHIMTIRLQEGQDLLPGIGGPSSTQPSGQCD